MTFFNEELGRHRGGVARESVYYLICGGKNERVVHVLWECPGHRDSRDTFVVILRELLGEFQLIGLLMC